MPPRQNCDYPIPSPASEYAPPPGTKGSTRNTVDYCSKKRFFVVYFVCVSYFCDACTGSAVSYVYPQRSCLERYFTGCQPGRDSNPCAPGCRGNNFVTFRHAVRHPPHSSASPSTTVQYSIWPEVSLKLQYKRPSLKLCRQAKGLRPTNIQCTVCPERAMKILYISSSSKKGLIRTDGCAPPPISTRQYSPFSR
jgi:hypothetical protein